MSDHDGIIANDTGAAVRADLNLLAQAILNGFSGTSAPAAPVAYQIWHDTTNALVKQRNAANTAWLVRGNIADTFVLARSTDTILGVGDFGRTLNCTSTFTQTFTAAATLGDGWFCQIRNDGSGVITLDPNGAETIDGAATLALQPGESCIIWCNGSLFVTIGRGIEIATQAEQETGTDVLRAVTPGRQQFHPSAAKGWIKCDNAGAVLVSYNVTSITDDGTGLVTVTWNVDFSTADYPVLWMPLFASNALACSLASQVAGSCQIRSANLVDSPADPSNHLIAAFGDQ